MEQLKRKRFLRGAGLRRVDGLTLIEVMMAMAVLAFGLLAMLAMQLHAMRGGRVGAHVSQAATVARDRMEMFHRLPWTDPQVAVTGGWVIGGDAVNTAIVTNGAPVVQQVYNVDWRITGDPNPDLRHIDVRVTWREPSDPIGMPNRRFAVSSTRFGG